MALRIRTCRRGTDGATAIVTIEPDDLEGRVSPGRRKRPDPFDAAIIVLVLISITLFVLTLLVNTGVCS